MQTMQTHFTESEVAVYAVNWREPIAAVNDYIAEFGIRARILLDNETGLTGCYNPPAESPSLYEHYHLRVGDPYSEPPFPLQVVVGADGQLKYRSRDHDPEALIDVLYSLTQAQ